jgi:hypothetical protein
VINGHFIRRCAIGLVQNKPYDAIHYFGLFHEEYGKSEMMVGSAEEMNGAKQQS